MFLTSGGFSSLACVAEGIVVLVVEVGLRYRLWLRDGLMKIYLYVRVALLVGSLLLWWLRC